MSTTLRNKLIAAFVVLVVLAAVAWWLMRGNAAEHTLAAVSGTDPIIAEAEEESFPTVGLAKATGW